MKRLFWPILCVALLVIQSKLYDHNGKERRMTLAENSYATGCLAEAYSVCSRISDVLIRGQCYEDAFVNCPKKASRFRDWLDKGPK
jgi:hypothetical protein